MQLRPYQERVVSGLWDWFIKNQHSDSHPIIEACVGAGKSLVIAEICKRAVVGWPGTKIIVIVHQRELLEQNVEKLRRMWPEAKIGIWSAAMGRKQLGDVTVATIGSIYKHAAAIANSIGQVAMILADECHLIQPSEDGMWRTFITEMRRYSNPGLRVCGLTGTPFRGNGVWLTAGEKPLFTHITARVKIGELLELGFLAPLVPANAPQLVDASKTKTSGGDYNLGELEKLVDDDGVVLEACKSIVELGKNRKRWLVFCVTIEHAKHVGRVLTELGVKCGVVTGLADEKADRKASLREFKFGDLQCVVNIGVLTTGFDAPEVDFIALLRPTKSLVLYVQMMGRGMRVIGKDLVESIANGKENCLVADFTGTVKMLGPVDAVTGRLPTKRSKKEEAPHRICPNCGSSCSLSATECLECGHVFEREEKASHGTYADTGALLSEQLVEAAKKPERRRITHTQYAMHKKEGRTASMVCHYYDGPQRLASEWVCLAHTGMPRMKAIQWWRKRVRDPAWANAQPPTEISVALEVVRKLKTAGTLVEPTELDLMTFGKYPEIVGEHFGRVPDPTAEVRGHEAGIPPGAQPVGQGAADHGASEGQLPQLRKLSSWVVPPVQSEGSGPRL